MSIGLGALELKINKPVNILILKGVKLEHLNVKTVDIPKSKKEYTEIPRQFTGVDSWPKSSNLKCWECDLIPDSYPKFIPQYPTYKEGQEPICDVYGHFDDWACAARHIEREFPRNKWDMLSSLCIFEALFSKNKKDKIQPALAKTVMQDYCGASGLTPAQYKKQRTGY